MKESTVMLWNSQNIRISVLIIGMAVPWARADHSGLSAEPYLAAVRRFADAVLEHGRDRYGERPTPLFVDGLHADTLEPVVWKWRNGEEWVLSNFANQQPLLRLLDGLTTLTGEGRYREAAEAAARYVLEHGLSPSGLPSWGGHAAWDLKNDVPVGNSGGPADGKIIYSNHELKSNQPYFELMWRINPEATRRLMAMIWQAHITNWETLDYNRHGKMNNKREIVWDHPFDETGPVPFPTDGGNLSFSACTAPFVRSGVLLYMLGGEEKPLVWARRMTYQWQRARHPKTGLSAAQLSWRRGHDRAIEALGHVYPQINEASILASYHPAGRYHVMPLAQMQAGEVLLASPDEKARRTGEEFVVWAVDDLKTYGRQAVDWSTGLVPPRLTDGTPIRTDEMKPGYFTPEDFLPQPVDGWLFWGCALAYRHSRDTEIWSMARSLGRLFQLGEFGEPDGAGRTLALPDLPVRDRRLLYGLLELHRATGDDAFLRLAARVGDHLLALQAPSGLFPRPAPPPRPEGVGKTHDAIPGVEQPARRYARTGDEIPLALLHLAAAIEGRRADLPQAVSDDQYFHCRYFGPLAPYQRKFNDVRTYDYLVFYGIEE